MAGMTPYEQTVAAPGPQAQQAATAADYGAGIGVAAQNLGQQLSEFSARQQQRVDSIESIKATMAIKDQAEQAYLSLINSPELNSRDAPLMLQQKIQQISEETLKNQSRNVREMIAPSIANMTLSHMGDVRRAQVVDSHNQLVRANKDMDQTMSKGITNDPVAFESYLEQRFHPDNSEAQRIFANIPPATAQKIRDESTKLAVQTAFTTFAARGDDVSATAVLQSPTAQRILPMFGDHSMFSMLTSLGKGSTFQDSYSKTLGTKLGEASATNYLSNPDPNKQLQGPPITGRTNNPTLYNQQNSSPGQPGSGSVALPGQPPVQEGVSLVSPPGTFEAVIPPGIGTGAPELPPSALTPGSKSHFNAEWTRLSHAAANSPPGLIRENTLRDATIVKWTADGQKDSLYDMMKNATLKPDYFLSIIGNNDIARMMQEGSTNQNKTLANDYLRATLDKASGTMTEGKIAKINDAEIDDRQKAIIDMFADHGLLDADKKQAWETYKLNLSKSISESSPEAGIPYIMPSLVSASAHVVRPENVIGIGKSITRMSDRVIGNFIETDAAKKVLGSDADLAAFRIEIKDALVPPKQGAGTSQKERRIEIDKILGTTMFWDAPGKMRAALPALLGMLESDMARNQRTYQDRNATPEQKREAVDGNQKLAEVILKLGVTRKFNSIDDYKSAAKSGMIPPTMLVTFPGIEKIEGFNGSDVIPYYPATYPNAKELTDKFTVARANLIRTYERKQ